MRDDNLTGVIRAVPFRPFEMIMADGARIDVRHLEWIAYAGGRTAIVTDPDDRIQFIDVLMITMLDLAPPVPAGSPAPEPNGGQ